ncbi:MAG: hypothetical protein U0452_07895 [Anaerolineae bacterium]
MKSDLGKLPVERIIPQTGCIQAWVSPTEFNYGVSIPVQPFDSGLEWVYQPETPTFELNPFPFPVRDWRDLEGQAFRPSKKVVNNSTVYVGSAHNPVDVLYIHFGKRVRTRFQLTCVLFCDFDHEGVAQNETIALVTEVDFWRLRIGAGYLSRCEIDIGEWKTQVLVDMAQSFVEMSAYQPEPIRDKHSIWFLPTDEG